jgi:hypothetical protein
MDIIDYLVAKNLNWFLPNDYKNILDTDKYIPNNCFGVFVTTRRSITHKLKLWPEDIHGCIGNWDSQYNKLPKDIIFKYILETGYKSFFNDSRNKYFKPMIEDPNLQIEIDYMLDPIYKVNESNGYIYELNTVFNNKDMGLIYENKLTGQRSTYLPGVFENISWDEIKNSLEKKAGSTKSNNNKIFYSYKIKQIKKKLIDCTHTTSGYFKEIRKLFIKTVLYHSEKMSFVPFEIIFNEFNNKIDVKINKDEIIRNTGTLHDILEYIPNDNKSKYLKINGIKDTFEYYKNKFIETPIETLYNKLQEYSFIIPLLNNQNDKIEKLFYFFINNLDKIERQFSFSEIVLCFIKYYNNDSNKIKQLIKNIKKYYYNSFNINKLELNNIFQLNWDSKVIKKLYIYNDWNNIIEQYTKYWLKYEMIFPYDNINNIETNYLVVLLEGLTNIKYILKNNEKLDKLLLFCFNECVKNRIKHGKNDKIEGCLYFNSDNKLYKHRIDISCHFYNQI